jgi:hypothetical protein
MVTSKYPREIQRPDDEEGCPSVDPVREAHDARGGRDTLRCEAGFTHEGRGRSSIGVA